VSTRYDEWFQKYTRRFFGFSRDWRLFKAQAMAESNLNPAARSPTGARGIMQILPSTFREIKSENPELQHLDRPDWNIAAGIYYDRKMYDFWDVPESDGNRDNFMFGSYHAGTAPILRAQRIASAAGLNHEIWRSIEAVAHRVARWNSHETIPYIAQIHRYYQRLTSGTASTNGGLSNRATEIASDPAPQQSTRSSRTLLTLAYPFCQGQFGTPNRVLVCIVAANNPAGRIITGVRFYRNTKLVDEEHFGRFNPRSRRIVKGEVPLEFGLNTVVVECFTDGEDDPRRLTSTVNCDPTTLIRDRVASDLKSPGIKITMSYPFHERSLTTTERELSLMASAHSPTVVDYFVVRKDHTIIAEDLGFYQRADSELRMAIDNNGGTQRLVAEAISFTDDAILVARQVCDINTPSASGK
jgi:membrane-bound lytic murein transglycosylase F